MENKLFPTVYPVTCHTDHVGAGSIFVAIQGRQENGIQYIPLALKKGATTIVVQRDQLLSEEIKTLITDHKATLVYVDNSRKALALLSAQHLNYPAQKLKIIGVTGTKGKTTTTFIVEHLLRNAGYKTALLSTIQNKIVDYELPTALTTRHPDYLYVFFDQCIRANVDYVVMEVAAQAISLHRVEGIQFDALIFTNFSQEHGEFYSTLHDYFQAKCSLFSYAKPNALCFVNADDQWCQKIQRDALMYFSLKNKRADFYGQFVESQSYLIMNSFDYRYPLVGMFNAYNVMAAVSLCLALGMSEQLCQQNLKTIPVIPGRMEGYVLAQGARCFIDYAHNPSSFEAILSTVRSMTNHLIVVFGCGGDRDKEKRPVMGNIAATYADAVILTSDNPRSEDPVEIMRDIAGGVEAKNYSKIVQESDREKAIIQACTISRSDSIIMLLGKGPERYQLIGNEKYYFNEAEIVKRLC